MSLLAKKHVFLFKPLLFIHFANSKKYFLRVIALKFKPPYQQNLWQLLCAKKKFVLNKWHRLIFIFQIGWITCNQSSSHYFFYSNHHLESKMVEHFMLHTVRHTFPFCHHQSSHKQNFVNNDHPTKNSFQYTCLILLRSVLNNNKFLWRCCRKKNFATKKFVFSTKAYRVKIIFVL